MTDTPIGIFDSGVGGLTVARAILDQLPHEQLCYLGDTAHVPYGPKPIAEVRWHALAGLDGDADTFARLARRFFGAELFATVTGDPAALAELAAAAGDASGSRHLTASAAPAETVATAAASGSGPIAVSAASVGAPP